MAGVVIVGGGPAAVSAAWPFATSNVPLTIIEPGTTAISQTQSDTSLFPRKEYQTVSPKVRSRGIPRGAYAVNAQNRIQTENFLYTSTMFSGGASALWGAVVGLFQQADLKDWPIDQRDLANAATEISKRIALSGDRDRVDQVWQGLTLQPQIQQSDLGLLIGQPDCAPSKIDQASTVGFAPAISAVATQLHQLQGACDLQGTCFHACPNNSIYDASMDLTALQKLQHIEVKSGWMLDELIPQENRWCLQLKSTFSEERTTIEADKVILCAGALASLRHGIRATGLRAMSPIYHNPLFSAAFIAPKMLARPRDTAQFGLAQATCSVPLSDDPYDRAEGVFYDATGLPIGDLVGGVPLTIPATTDAVKSIASAITVGLFYLPGSYASNTATIHGKDDELILRVKGGVTPECRSTMKRALSRVKDALRHKGMYMLPGSFQEFSPGADSHYAGGFGMGTHSSAFGQIAESPDLYVADSSSFPSLPACHLTFMSMCNAHRIGKYISEKSVT